MDRGIINVDWCNLYSHLVVEKLEKGITNHSPLLIEFPTKNHHKSVSFRFLNVPTQHDDFYKSVIDVW